MKSLKFKINGVAYEASVNELSENNVEVTLNGKVFVVEMEHKAISMPTVRPTRMQAVAPKGQAVSKNIKSPLPGSIMKVLVKAGQNVKRGDILLTMESMKMENNIAAEMDGIVKAVHVQPGQNVMQDDLLIEFEHSESVPEVTKPVIQEPVSQTVTNVATSAKSLKSPLPGTILKVLVKEGQSVKRGDVLLTMESMKMENNITSEIDGTIKTIHVQPGQNVMQDNVLLDFA